MVSTSKILTVSYGTFSCTLEGFDDSFTAMKAIAEYFRDLAADDRYFGAEPPQPDAELLAAIAARETARQVQAHTDGSDIVLRADTGAAALIEAEDAVDEEKTKKKNKKKAKGSKKAKGKAKAAARRAAKAAAAADVVTDITAEDQFSTPDAAAPVVEANLEPEATLNGDVLGNVLAASDDELAEIEPDAADREFSEVPVADTDSVAAKLQRIRSVVDQDDTDAFNEDQDAGDLHEPLIDGGLDQVDAFETETIASDIEALDSEAEPVETQPFEQVDSDDFDVSRFAETLADSDDDTAEALEDDTVASDDDETYDDDDFDMSSIIDSASDGAKADNVAEVEAAPVTPTRPRVIKVKRAEFEKVIADGQLEEDVPEEIAEDAVPVADIDGLDELEDLVADEAPAQLSDEDEADLQSELEEAEELGRSEGEARALLEAQSDDDEAMSSRLLEKANEQMREPDNSRRRNAIAHLKAAVAAKEAARKMGEPDDTEAETQNAFREDLSQIVKPRRPVAQGNRSSRPTPLKLVASQRVDAPAVAPKGPVSPRRVLAQTIDQDSYGDDTSPETASGFAEFAESMGASSLLELLEAAAAYTAFVEGKVVFTRPQVMQKVKGVKEDDFSREDGLRSFGKLLRQGRIQKIKAGQFQVAEDSRFRPEDRAAS